LSKPAIATQALTRRFGDKVAVDHLDLHVPWRSVYGFLEPNGAGKSTTIRLLLGLLRLTEGTVHLLGQPFQPNQRVLLWRIGTLVEMPSLYSHLTGRENLSASSIDWWEILRSVIFAYLSAWLILVLHHWMSMRWSSFTVALGVAVVATMGIIEMGSSQWWIVYRWTFPLTASSGSDPANARRHHQHSR